MSLTIHNDFIDPVLNISNLGSFYSGRFDDIPQLLALFDSWGLDNEQIAIGLSELAYLSSRHETRLFQRKYIIKVRIFKSELNAERLTTLTYGLKIDDEVIQYGNPSDPSIVYRYGIPIWLVNMGYPVVKDVAKINLICNEPADAKTILVSDMDYIIADSSILFKRDPFSSGEFTVQSTVNPDTQLQEDYIDLWFRDVYLDLKDMQETYGSAVGLYGPNTDAYKRLVNAYWDCVVDCPGLEYINKLIGAILDCPVSEDTETIEAVGKGKTYNWIATNKKVYKMSLDAEPIYPVGETVQRGTFLCNTVTLVRTDTYTSIYPDEIYIPTVYLNREIKNPVGFNNAVTTLSTVNGNLYFDLLGNSEDVTTFWSLYHEHMSRRGLDGNVALRQAARNNQIVPIRFLFDYIINNNYVVYSIDKSKRGSEALSIETLNLIRRIIPPGQTILFI